MAVSAPHWISCNGEIDFNVFTSDVPFSLQNAFRDAVEKAVKGQGSWGQSNFVNWKDRNRAFLLMNYWEEELGTFLDIFNDLDPNILFIGAMTLSLPGAIEIAKIAREIKGKDIFIVIGGKHCNETLYLRRATIENLEGSPLKLMANGAIPRLFDLVFSGDGEKAISSIGEIIELLMKRGLPFHEFYRYKEKFEEAEGDWLAGEFRNDQIFYYKGIGKPINYLSLGFTLDKFNLGTGFKVLETTYTAHVYSDLSKGCPFNCFFCSEKNYINGKLRLKDTTSADRLHKQFSIAYNNISPTLGNETLSLFVEDSIFLGARKDLTNHFIEKTINANIKIPFGCQFTVDTFLFSITPKTIDHLIKIGLKYVTFGVETIDESIAKTFSKNTSKENEWNYKIEQVVKRCKNHGLKCGMFLLWGLGESSFSRKKQLIQILEWTNKYKVTIDIGLNIATEHPLQNKENKYNYLKWGTSKESPYLNYFVKYFGEASEEYKSSKINYPTPQELDLLIPIYEEIKKKAYEG